MRLSWLSVCLLLPLVLASPRVQDRLRQLLSDTKKEDSASDWPGLTPRPAPPPELSFLAEYYQRPVPELLTKQQISLTCLACETAVASIIDLYLLGVDFGTIEAALEGLCDLLGIFDKEVCHGAIDNYGPIIEFIVLNREPRIKAGEICAAVVGRGCGAWEEINNWEVELPSLPQVSGPVPPPVHPEQGESLKVLHLTDIHIDLTYTEGSESQCGRPMCCSNTTGLASSPATEAGHWGDFSCDVPAWTYTKMLEHIKEVHGASLEYIMITGDYPAHDVWLQSRQHNLDTAQAVLQPLTQIFPDTQVFPALGNHEPYPCNIFPGSTAGVDESYDPDWLLSSLSQYFSSWLPQPQLDTFRQFGGYSYSWRPGFRVISLPSPLCLTYNFFLWMDWSDPGDMLAWLVEELHKAELEGEKVTLLSHVPPGNGECLGAWGREYSRIITRFHSTISAQFHGHTHNDHFSLHYDTSGHPLAVGYISPSVSTYTDLNPGYRIYSLDPVTHQVIDTETWVLDLSASNAVTDPVFYKLYSAREDLEMDNLGPLDWENVVKRLNSDNEYYQKWLNYFYKAGPAVNDPEPKRKILCELLTTSNLDTSKCDEILGAA